MFGSGDGNGATEDAEEFELVALDDASIMTLDVVETGAISEIVELALPPLKTVTSEPARTLRYA